MSDLSFTERLKLEQLFGMESGYVLNFSNRTFQEFIQSLERRQAAKTEEDSEVEHDDDIPF